MDDRAAALRRLIERVIALPVDFVSLNLSPAYFEARDKAMEESAEFRRVLYGKERSGAVPMDSAARRARNGR